MRLTADCPLLDPAVLAQTIRLRSATGVDYASNFDPPTWPDGLDCEVLTREALFAAAKESVGRAIGSMLPHSCATTVTASARRRWSRRCPVWPPSDGRWIQPTTSYCCGPWASACHGIVCLRIWTCSPYLIASRSFAPSTKRRFVTQALPRSFEADKLDLDRRFERSQQLIERAERTIPIGSQTFSKSKLQLPPGAAPLFVTHGDGGRVYDVDGNQYVDLIGGLLPNVLGYRDPDVDLAIRRQLTRGITFSLATTLEMELAERLIRHIPCAEMVRFGKNGTDATSAAVRLARAATRRDRLIMLGYHGWQDWYIGATTRNLGVPSVVSALSHLAPYGDLAAIEALLGKHPGEFAAVILEPMNTVEPAPGYLASPEGVGAPSWCAADFR